MFKTKQQKIIFFTSIGLAALLVIITIVSSVPFQYNNTTDYKKLAEQDAKDQAAYQKYLDSIQPDPVASKDIFQSLITEADVKKDVEAELDINQKIVLPEIADSSIVMDKNNDKTAVVNYFTKFGALTQQFNNQAVDASNSFFAPDADPAALAAASNLSQNLLVSLQKTPVPQDAVAFHKATLATFQNYQNLAQTAADYNAQKVDSPWSTVYKNYSIVNQEIASAKTEYSKLDKKYSLSDLPPQHIALNPNQINSPFIKSANAIFGLGDTTVVIGDIPAAIEKAVREALAAAFAHFITVYLDKMITAIESNYKIANFLYYTDALVKGQYVNDYLTKYVTQPLDRQIVTRFIPQFNCGASNADLKAVFKAKAQTYLGYDPAKVSPSDPLFAQKLARAGDYLASPQGWQQTFEGIAQQALSTAEKAANQELTSSGLKSPRDIIGKQITASLSAIANSQSAAIFSGLNLGVVNVSSIVGKIVSGVIDNLFNKFLFKGAVVLKEQSACIAVPQLQPVIPATHTDYQEPPPPPTPQDIYNDLQQHGTPPFAPR